MGAGGEQCYYCKPHHKATAPPGSGVTSGGTTTEIISNLCSLYTNC